MAKYVIALVDLDKKYLDVMEWKLMQELGNDVEFHAITEMEYFDTYFAAANTIDVLIVNSRLYDERIQKQNTKMVFVLNEDMQDAYQDGNTYYLYKYIPVNEITRYLLEMISKNMNIQTVTDENRVTKGILVYSPIGGSGKTTSALGISMALQKLGKKVLYMNLETVQNFQWFLSETEYAYDGLERFIANREDHAMAYLQNAIGHEIFDYVKPFKQTTLAYGIDMESYLYFIEQVIAANLYDFVVFDVSSELSMLKTKLMGKCQKVIFVMQQDALSVWKMEQFFKNIDVSEENKFLYLCNNYEEEKTNYILNSEYLKNHSVAEYINHENADAGTIKLKTMEQSGIFTTTAYMLI